MEQSSEVEILVHITAPSRAADDKKYRSLASAYLDFEPAVHLPVYSTSLAAEEHVSSNDHEGSQLPQHNSSQNDNRREFPLSGETIWTPRGSSPSASFRSALDNAKSPAILARSRDQLPQAPAPAVQSSQATESSLQTLPSVVEDSVPQNHVVAASFTSPTRVLEHYLQAFDSPSQPRVRSSGESFGEVIASTPVRGPSSQCSDGRSRQACSPPPVIPRTPFPAARAQTLGNIFHNSARNQEETSIIAENTICGSDQAEEDLVDETIILSSFETSGAARADSEPLPRSKCPKVLPDSSPRQLTRASSDVGPTTTAAATTTTASTTSSRRRSVEITVNFLPSHGFKYEDLELLAPEPTISAGPLEPEALVTANLARLAQSLDAAQPFRPRTQARALRLTERGYWVVDCRGWSPRLRRDAWAFLANYVGTGAAGWGVACRRDADFAALRAYCWGAVVPHVYRLLYVISESPFIIFPLPSPPLLRGCIPPCPTLSFSQVEKK